MPTIYSMLFMVDLLYQRSVDIVTWDELSEKIVLSVSDCFINYFLNIRLCPKSIPKTLYIDRVDFTERQYE